MTKRTDESDVMADDTKETRTRPKRPMKRERVNLAIADIRDILMSGKFNRGEVAGMLAALLAHALREGVDDSDRREALLAQVVDLVRQLWADADAREQSKAEPVM